MPVFLDIKARLDELSAKAAVDGVTKTFGTEGGETVAKEFADQMAAHLSSASTISRLTGSLNKLEKYGDESGKNFAEEMAKSLDIHLRDVGEKTGGGFMQSLVAGMRQHSEIVAQGFEGVENAAKKMGVSISEGGMLAAGGVAAIGLAAVEGTKKLFEMGEQWADLEDKIAFTTGRTGEAAKAMTDDIAKIGDSTGAPLAAIGDVYTQLSRLKDLQGEALNDLTKQVSDYDSMAKQAGADPLNLAAFTRTMQEFHVPAGQMRSDLNDIVAAAQDGQVPINDLVEQLKAAGPLADIAGLSFGQIANVLASVDESGLDSTKVLNGFRIALGNIAADSKQMQKLITFGPDEDELQRLKDVVQKIQEYEAADKDIAANDLGRAAFGKSWTEIGDAIKNGTLNVDKMNTSMTEAGNRIGDMKTATEHFGDEWQKTKNKIDAALKPLSEDVFKFLDDGLKGFEKHLDDFTNGGSLGWLIELEEGPGMKALEPWLRSHLGNTNAAGDGTEIGGGNGPHGTGGDSARSSAGSGALAGAAIGGGLSTGSTYSDYQSGFQKSMVGKGKSGLTGDTIDAQAPFYPLDLNPADKPGTQTYDEWISGQKAVQSAQNSVTDSGNEVAKALAEQAALTKKGHPTQDELNKATSDLNKATRDNATAQQDLTITQNKQIEDANKSTKDGKNPWDTNPFDSPSGDSGIAKLASLATMFVTNLALGNPVGTIAAEKLGGSPSNPMYVSPVGGTTADQLTNLGNILVPPAGAAGAPAVSAPSTAVGQAGTAATATSAAPGWTGAPSAQQVPTGKPSGSQADIAAQIIQGGLARGAPTSVIKSALEAGAVESSLQNLHYGDRDSQGIFQMRPSQGWGTVAQVTDPNYEINKWYDTALGKPGAAGMDSGALAQSVEGSAFPARYGQHAAEAQGYLDQYDTAHAPGPGQGGPRGPSLGPMLSPAPVSPIDAVPGGSTGPTGSIGGIPVPAGVAAYGPGHVGASLAGGMGPAGVPRPGTAAAAATKGNTTPVNPTTSPPPDGTGKGTTGLGGLPLAAAMTAASAIPGLGQAAQVGIQEANRAVQFAGQVGAIAVQGIGEELELHDPDGGKKNAGGGWIGKLAGGFAGAHPSAPNTAGATAPPKGDPKPGDPASGQGAGNTPGPGNNGQGTPGNNVGVNIENMHVASPDHGQQVAGDINWASYNAQSMSTSGR